ncbi:hypothetical protein JTB14_003929 [Gonioctena quinquepunctata]|nr:hypothetical protein JTB14_003929 [Gonioctena quinquepunctata]
MNRNGESTNMGTLDVSQLVEILRPSSHDVFSEKNISEDIHSFHMVQTSNIKANFIRDVQFLLDLIQKTYSLRITPDLVDSYSNVDISRFKNKLRSQIQELTCCRSLKTVGDVLEKCGGDNSQRYSWNELKKANFSHNAMFELDDTFECTLSLHTLDLSHNKLREISFLNQLPNLKHLNLAYNKLVSLPRFKGQICSRLQVLILNNNFIEDLQGLPMLSNLVQLDLAQNCLLDHKSLLTISHLVSLQWLNLQGNPLCFHPHHRNLTCNYLNKNASTVKFLLDGFGLSKGEKSMTGSYHPIKQSSQQDSPSNSSTGSIQEKPRRIRNVTIEESNIVEDIVPISTPSSSLQHLELKRQVEQLREEHGESWLYRHSGLMVQDALGFEKTSILSSTPQEAALDSLYMKNPGEVEQAEVTVYETANNTQESVKTEAFHTADAIFSNEAPEIDVSDTSDGEDFLSGGEECMFLATNKADGAQVFVVVTDTHISERDVTTSKERARWHINTVLGCVCDEENDFVRLEFDTLRRDRKQRLYELDTEEKEAFLRTVRSKMETRSETKVEKKTFYQCIKCSEAFQRDKNALIDQPVVTCPKCESNLVLESI